MLTNYTIIKPDGSEESGSIDWPERPNLDKMKKLIAPIVGGDIERVNVFWNGKYTDMFVHENGLEEGFARNNKATNIYWNNTLTHVKGAVQDDTCVVGTVVLFDRKVWF